MSFILKNYLLNFSKFINILIQTSKLVYSKNMKELIMNKNYFEIIKIVCESVLEKSSISPKVTTSNTNPSTKNKTG